METVRAPDSFEDIRSRRYKRGTVEWELKEGDSVSPHQTVGWINVGPDGEGTAMGICVDHFGRITTLLIANGVEVAPQQPLLEYDERPPTTDEYWERWEAANRAERRVRRLTELLRNPFKAFWASLTRSYRR